MEAGDILLYPRLPGLKMVVLAVRATEYDARVYYDPYDFVTLSLNTEPFEVYLKKTQPSESKAESTSATVGS
jgi:hypothetical protein